MYNIRLTKKAISRICEGEDETAERLYVTAQKVLSLRYTIIQ